MPPFKIITADERLRERRGAKVLLLGQPGVGKTYQLRTLPPETTLFVDVEAGDLSVLDYPVPALRPQDWPALRDLAVKLGGPNTSLPPGSSYSRMHFDNVGGALENRQQIQTVFLDSITAIIGLAFRYCEQQPESVSERGKKDLRGTYGLLAREVLAWAHHLQHARDLNVIFVGILEFVLDDLKIGSWQLQAEGQRIGRELPGIIDEIITYQFLNFGDDKPPQRGFVTTSPNPWGYPAKDRSGRLDQIELPDLGRLLAKLTTNATKNEIATENEKQKENENAV